MNGHSLDASNSSGMPRIRGMLQPPQKPASSLIADPLALGRFASAMDAIKEVLAHPELERNITKVERTLLDAEQMPCPVIHRFGPDVYIREIHMPAGAFCIGAHHKKHHLNLMLKGRVTVRNDDGTTSELVAPLMFIGKPGKKIGYVHEDVVWQNIYGTDETDIETLESMFVEKGKAWAEDNEKRKRPTIRTELDRLDYERVLSEYGIPHAIARAQSENTSDMRPFPLGSYKVMVTDSPIEGRGLFATAPISKGEVIAPARVGEQRTPAGRYTNHSAFPNAKFVLRQNNDLDLVALRDIEGMVGGRVGEEITIDYRQALEIRKQLCQQQLQQQ